MVSSTAPQPVLGLALPDTMFRHHWPQLPDGTALNQFAMDARGRATLGKARQRANPSGCGSG